jgi:hypothetical protein
VSQNSRQVRFDEPNATGKWLKQLVGCLLYYQNLRAPVLEQVASFLEILPLVDAR